MKEQTTRQDETLVAQLEERPLLKKQLQLEQEDAAKAEAASDHDREAETNGASSEVPFAEKPRHHILEDHDRQLDFLEHSLRLVHTRYYKHYDRLRASQQGGRVAEIRGSKRKQPSETSDLTLIPDVKVIMPSLKHLVLEGVVIVLSGVIPLGWDIQTSDLAMWAKSFGATIEEEITKRTTHLVAARNRTAKVRQALKRGRGKIKIVGPQWLVSTLAQWTKLDEEPYLLDLEENETTQSTNEEREEDQPLSDSEGIASEKESADEDPGDGREKKTKPPLSIAIGDDVESDVEGVLPDDLEDQHSPVGGTAEDWDSMDAELQDFLGSEAGDSDGNESVSSMASSRSSKSTVVRRPKRGRELEDNMEQGMRKRPAPSRRTNLSKTSVASNITPEPSEARPTGKEGNGDDNNVTDEQESKRDEENSEDEEVWTELEQEFAAEMEKEGP